CFQNMLMNRRSPVLGSIQRLIYSNFKFFTLENAEEKKQEDEKPAHHTQKHNSHE
ncbi:hypothetical protein ACJX0J_008871, partial [Zea mays]